ncbi:hypothetical protein AVEN_65311-1 [Araneus ventricosus]|uniref:Uncharacterized protein n=1 Tax=Araneus ventricosus TaxID=182803 RepID=A0A4Y2AHK5_ARAVE|nr:hypothetical protein AVEN_65311-1 [Araneus ventricosus]
MYDRKHHPDGLADCDVFLSHEKRVEYLSLQPQTASQLHLMVIKKTSAKLTRIAPVVMKLRNHPTVRIDHWGHGSLVVGLLGFRMSSGVKGRRSSTP